MQYSLGIDAGGTYTDAVLVRDSDGVIVDSNKALTTYPDLHIGIKNVIDGLNPDYLKNIKLVSVSTTLSTNTILEGTGFPVAMILIGDHPLERELPTEHVLFVTGGHDHNGEEKASLDLKSIEKFALQVKDRVSAFAISSYFSTRNPEHELKAKDRILELTGLPVVCGHELSQELGAYERAVTAFLNAQLIPITRQFVQSIIKDIKERGINARLLMLKCDGSVVGIKDALQKPIETIFSGPAASLVGASYLSGLETCAVIDVGGTSTDISSICMGVPDLSDEGAVVGGWKTRVRAIRMETTATGGDSHIWAVNRELFLGPRRVIPLAVAAIKYPNFLNNLKRTPMPAREDLCENIQPTKFFVRSEYAAGELSKAEAEVLEVIGEEPVSVFEISALIRKDVHPQTLDCLIKKRLVQAIGFTPTDALHVLGEYTAWSEEASRIGAERLARLMRMTPGELCTAIKKKVARNMALQLLSYILTGVPYESIEKILDGNYPAKFKLQVPVVLLGGPVRAHRKELEEFIDADILVPEHAEVGNAVGALVGKGIKRAEILIRPASLMSPDKDFLIFAPGSRLRFDTYSEALETATDIGKKLVEDYMRDCGLSGNQVEISIEKKTVSPDGWNHPPMETNLLVVGVGMRELHF
ncbi:MAG TPA: hydantoinase/oxoprolinase family protein [Methanosarcina thermophila]|uniref:Dihydropyrimidinase n=2 Tax=Methanosarcina thermophila TaxID=2210 RepID=A0A3G9D055_METTE|nr:hydantoinase/oxoprolinase family protein [Methanosarcina thermophila]AKB12677.1 Hydantoinase [Methanosarcina thermophila TM-1]BAW30411.1 dihydropyrimidinase [Methanosarcina thermophila]HOA68814.1 hydantoinase/oxoprolinase family protein [Methanosarcina thermophila]HOQ64876.1 hydantoinase/oxoprolinase family protein [Methanosarcina thermophila]HPT80907.1 hydantoinase/oxoprolinase family protein [Methanosarcina thermophila]